MDVVGIDAGGTKTVCLLADATAAIVAEARGPGANLQSLGELKVEKILHELIDRVAGDRPDRPAAICVGMAGVDRPADARTVNAILSRLVLRARTLVVNDALIALEAGSPGHPAILLLAGTGAIAYGRNGHNKAARAGGWGYLLADEGSGYWLGREALRAVMRAADRRAPPTLLTERVLAHHRVSHPHDLVREVYDRPPRPADVAALAGLVDAAAADGDVTAREIIDRGALELVRAALAVADQIDLRTGPVILGGGVMTGLPGLAAAVRARLASELPEAEVRTLAAEPAMGAVHLALRLARGAVPVPMYTDRES